MPDSLADFLKARLPAVLTVEDDFVEDDLVEDDLAVDDLVV